jgi:hypothetical protein
MQFFYGAYVHQNNEVFFSSINRTMRRGQTQRAWILNVNWQLEGKLIGEQDVMFAQLNEMILAYGTDGYSAGMLANDGSFSPFTINGALALGGTRITSPVSHNTLKGADGATYLKYKIGLEADFAWAAATDPMSFSESITFRNIGGGPMYQERIPINGPPIFQQVSSNSWFYATQQGTYSQSGPNPSPADYIFPAQYLRTSAGDGSQVTYSAPKTIQGVPIEYAVSWKYEFISPNPLVGWPHVVG